MMIEMVQKPRGKGWQKAAPLFQVDKRTALGRKVDELTRIFANGLGLAALSPLQAEQCQRAAQLTAIAELARLAYAEGRESLDQMVRAERVASLAVKRLGINHSAQKTEPVDLDSYLAGKEAGR